jgi:hypothetical protein
MYPHKHSYTEIPPHDTTEQSAALVDRGDALG